MLISISGKAGSGKDTIGSIINYLTCCNSFWRHNKKVPEQFTFELFNSSDYTGVIGRGDFKIKKYSDKLKDMVCILIGCTREQLEDQTFKATPLGEEWRRVIDLRTGKFADTDIIEVQNIARNHVLTPRDILQFLGTDFGRDMIHPNVWINSLFADYHSGIKMSDYTESKWIITDSRFPNDVERVKSLGGITIRVNRKSNILPCVGHEFQHPSETALDDYKGFNYTINNNGSIDDLIEVVKEILKKENII